MCVYIHTYTYIYICIYIYIFTDFANGENTESSLPFFLKKGVISLALFFGKVQLLTQQHNHTLQRCNIHYSNNRCSSLFGWSPRAHVLSPQQCASSFVPSSTTRGFDEIVVFWKVLAHILWMRFQKHSLVVLASLIRLDLFVAEGSLFSWPSEETFKRPHFQDSVLFLIIMIHTKGAKKM